MTTYLGHTIEAKKTSALGQFRAFIDGKLDRSIPPAKYKGVLYRRVKIKYRIVWSKSLS